MKVAVVRPSASGRPVRPALMPRQFALLQGQTPPGVELSYYDEWLDPLPELFEADALAIMADANAAQRAQRLADKCRRQGRTVLLWGEYPAAEPQEAKRYADAVLCGEVFSCWRQAMEDLERGDLQPYYKAENGFPPTLADYDYSLFAPGLYPTGAVVEVELAAAPPQDVAKIPQRRIVFTAPALLQNEVLAEAWLAGVAPLGKRWACRVGAQEAQNPRLLQLMHGAGCRLAMLDAAEMGLLADDGTGAPLICRPDEMVQNIHAAGLMICAHFSEDSPRALAFAQKHRLAGATFPKTESGHKARSEFHRAPGRWWRWLACRANRGQPTAYMALAKILKKSKGD